MSPTTTSALDHAAAAGCPAIRSHLVLADSINVGDAHREAARRYSEGGPVALPPSAALSRSPGSSRGWIWWSPAWSRCRDGALS